MSGGTGVLSAGALSLARMTNVESPAQGIRDEVTLSMIASEAKGKPEAEPEEASA